MCVHFAYERLTTTFPARVEIFSRIDDDGENISRNWVEGTEIFLLIPSSKRFQ